MSTRRRLFLRRAGKYLLLMLLPTVLLMGIFFYSGVQSQQKALRADGQATMDTVQEYCSLTLDHALNQNDMLGTTRVLMVLRRMLFSAKMSYSDSTIFNMLKVTMSSMVNSDDAMDSITYWLEDSTRVFTTDGSGILQLEAVEDRTWLEAYQGMSGDRRTLIYPSGDARKPGITVVSRLLLKGGCYVLRLDAEALRKKLLPMLHRQETLLLTNEAGQLLMTVNGGRQSLTLTEEELRGLTENASGTWITLQGQRYLYEYRAGKHMNTITLVPQSVLYARLRELFASFAWVLLIDLLVVGTLAGIMTQRITRQLHGMIDMFDRAMQGLPIEKPRSGDEDEYAIIANNIAYMYLQDATLRSRMQQETLQKENAELMALQLQINPHFLYNTLQTMDFAILSGTCDKQDISDAFHDLSAILRYALSDPQRPVTLAKELEKLRSYAEIQRFRFGGRFVLYVEVEDSLLRASVFRMMLQPLVENSMIHGLNGLKERGHIWVRAEKQGDRLRVTVEDSGVGMTEEERQQLLQRINNPDSRSIGLTNLNRRLILRYGRESGLEIDAAPGRGTKVSFTIPYEEEEEGTEKVSSDIRSANNDTILP